MSELSPQDRALIRAAKAYEAIPSSQHRALLMFAAMMFVSRVREENDLAVREEAKNQ